MEIKQTILQPFGSSEQMGGGSIAWTVGRGVIGSPAAEGGDLYQFSSVVFTPGGAQGGEGPTLSQAISGAGNPTWAKNFIRMPGYQGIIHWTVPKTGTYEFDVFGAASSDGNKGGRVVGRIELNKSDVIKLAVGQRGIYGGLNSWSGGGGSFVATLEDVPIFVAGGAGGSNTSFRSESQGGWATSLVGEFGSGGLWAVDGFGNTVHTGGAGGGFNENGQGDGQSSNGFGGTSFINGALGGKGDNEAPDSVGGFGGGGGGGGYGDGGGGGYVGGNTTAGDPGLGDGGTNYFGVNTTEISNEAGVSSGSGKITITYI
jgi:hypothetical protein